MSTHQTPHVRPFLNNATCSSAWPSRSVSKEGIHAALIQNNRVGHLKARGNDTSAIPGIISGTSAGGLVSRSKRRDNPGFVEAGDVPPQRLNLNHGPFCQALCLRTTASPSTTAKLNQHTKKKLKRVKGDVPDVNTASPIILTPGKRTPRGTHSSSSVGFGKQRKRGIDVSAPWK